MEARNVLYQGLRSELRGEMQTLHENWGWILATGILLCVLGCIAIAGAWITTLATVGVVGSLVTIGGLFQIFRAFSFGLGHGLLVHLALGILYTVVGWLMMTRPVSGAVSLTLLIAAFLISAGIFRTVWSAMTRFPQWGWFCFSGVLTALLGFYIASNLETTAFWLVGTIVGIELLSSGISWVMLSSAARRYAPADRSATASVDYPKKAG